MSNSAFGAARDVDPDLPLSPDGITYHLTARSADVADRILLVGDPGRVAVVAKHFDAGSVRYEASHREINIMTGSYNGVPVSVISTGMGTDNVEIVMNEIHILKEYSIARRAWRLRKGERREEAEKSGEDAEEFDPSRVKLIRVGTCGSPNDAIAVGCLAITRHAVGLDNTCQFYTAPAINASTDVQEVLAKVKATGLAKVQVYATKASPAITEALVAACDAFNAAAENDKARDAPAQPYYVGTTCSASGFYGCQGRSVGRFRGHLTVPHLMEELGELRFAVADGTERVANVEMETSSLCYLSNVLGYQAGTVCVVVARRSRTGKAFATPEVSSRGLENAIVIALDAVTSVA